MNETSYLIEKKLEQLSEKQLLAHPCFERDSMKILEQLSQIDLDLFNIQKKSALKSNKRKDSSHLIPFEDYLNSGSKKFQKIGNELLKEGKVGCIIMAGGQGTRLRFPGPKGCFPISNIRKKSLFQLFAEKIRAAGHKVQKMLPVAIMTSSANDEATRQFFHEHRNFGLSEDQLYFYTQQEWPLLDPAGHLFLDAQDHIATGPNGNGCTLHLFYTQGLWKLWKQQGIELICVNPVDNPLADPFDEEFIGFHHLHQNDASLKTIIRQDPQENLGVLVKKENHIEVIEYTELPLKEKIAVDERGNLKYRCANLSLFSFSMQFIENLVIKFPQLPIHWAKKATKFLDKQCKVIFPIEPNAWKFEQYVFDVLPYAHKIGALVYPRQHIFAPLKNFAGMDSIETVQTALQNADIQIFSKISGIEEEKICMNKPFELSQEFYYPTEELKNRWKNKPLPNHTYIEGVL